MGSYDQTRARPLAGGFMAPLGSVTDAELAARFRGYKRTIAGRYRALSNEEIERYTPPGKLLVSPKVDGELWYLVLEDGEAWLSNPGGRVIYGDVPILKEAAEVVGPRAAGTTILAGELFAVRKGGRPRHDDLARATSGGDAAEVARVGFMAFDLLQAGDGDVPERYDERLETIGQLVQGGKRLKAIPTDEMAGAEAVRQRYAELVESGKAEGLVLRTEDGRIYKLKPAMTLDAVVVGYTERADEPGLLRSMALALVREDGQFHLIGSCGNMSVDDRRTFLERLAPMGVEASFRHASNSGALYRFVRPELVIEVKVTDVLADEPNGDPVLRMVAEYDPESGWRAVRRMPGVSILHPVFVRVREDKEVNPVDVRMGQVLERVLVPDIEVHAETVELPPSEVLRREAYTKTRRGVTTVRKLLLWQTNKHEIDASYPAFVVHFTDYSPSRKDPLKREVRLAPTLAGAQAIADEMIEQNIKRGWQPA